MRQQQPINLEEGQERRVIRVRRGRRRRDMNPDEDQPVRGANNIPYVRVPPRRGSTRHMRDVEIQ